jgi:hypothetical protein
VFRPVAGPLDNMDPAALGFFEVDPGTSLDVTRPEPVLDEMSQHASSIDALLLPEEAVTAGFGSFRSPKRERGYADIAAEAFEGYIVRKDLARRFQGLYPVPTYVGEFLLGRYCRSTLT